MKKKIVSILLAISLALPAFPAYAQPESAEWEAENLETESLVSEPDNVEHAQADKTEAVAEDSNVTETEPMQSDEAEAEPEESDVIVSGGTETATPEAEPAEMQDFSATQQQNAEESFEPVKIRVTNEERALEIYWDRDVIGSDVAESYILKGGDQEYEIKSDGAWADRTFYYNINGRGFSSFTIYGYPYHLEQPITLEIRGEIRDAAEGSTAVVTKKVYPVESENYYTQSYTSECGVVCESGDEVSEFSLKAAGALVDAMLANFDAALKKDFLEWDPKIAVYGPNENIYSVPENRYDRDMEILDVNQEEGHAGHRYNDVVTSISEANLLRSTEGDYVTKYPDENLLVYEFAHTLKTLIEYEQGDVVSTQGLIPLYWSRMQAGMWANTRAAESTDEFFAYMTEIWFQVVPDAPDWNDGTYCPINTRAELKEYDPETYAFMEKLYGQPKTLPAPWDSVPDHYSNPAGAGIVTPEPPAAEGNQCYSENTYKLILKARNGRTYMLCSDGEYWPYLLLDDGMDSSDDELDLSSVWKVNRTEDGFYQFVAAAGANKGKALVEVDYDLAFVKADWKDRKQLWRYETLEQGGTFFVNAVSGHAFSYMTWYGAITSKKENQMHVNLEEKNRMGEEIWTLQNLDTGAEMLPHATTFDFSGAEFRISSAANGKSSISVQNGITMQNGKDSTKNSWWLDLAGDGWFYLESAEKAGQVLAPSGGSKSAGTKIVSTGKKQKDNGQLWKLEIENGSLRFRNRASGLVLAVKDTKAANNTELILAKEKSGDSSQLWNVKSKRGNKSLYPSDIPNVIDWERRSEEKEGVKGFVNRLYRNILGRKADQAGLESWIRVLQEGKEGGSETVANFVFSPEYEAKRVTDDEFVSVLYRTVLGREPDAAGKKAWLKRLEEGLTRRYIVAGFTHSQEFQSLCKSYGIKEGNFVSTEIVDQNEKVTAFVARLYRLVLQRDSDSDGLEDWVGQLLRHEAGAGEISKGFFFSWEFQWRYPGKEAFVDICYRTYLNREPDPNGKKAWVELLRRGQSLEQILDGFIGSQEFGNLCAAYGIER